MILVIAAYWTEDEADGATERLAEAIGDHIPGTGSVVAIEEANVDRELRQFLRSVHLEEPANA
jgi:hypothetical protein